ncbi:MAG: ABC transporter substrate-binding protein [Xanthomonadaceae bacterium]|nr:ABC transporter substrate-binding protein [Xanthomonadaceae bacterium]
MIFKSLAPAILSAAVLFWAIPASTLADEQAEPVQLVQQTTAELFELVNSRRDFYQENIDQLQADIRAILLPMVDEVYSARLVLGRSGRGLEREKVLEFSDALSDLLMRRYAQGLLDFETRDQVEVRPLSGENSDRMTRVKTRVALDNGQQAPVDYVFRKTDEGWKIFDVIVEGISYVTTFRNQIGEQLRQQGFDATLESLQRGNLELEEVELDGAN